MGLHGLGDRAVEVEPGKPLELGPFVVTFVPSFHSKLILGRKVPFDGPLTCEDVDALSPSAYKCGQVWGIQIEVAGTTLYHQGSCNLDDEALGKRPVDIFLAGVAGRTVTPRYWERVSPRLDPEVVVPTHYDDSVQHRSARERKFVRGAELRGAARKRSPPFPATPASRRAPGRRLGLLRAELRRCVAEVLDRSSRAACGPRASRRGG